MDDTTRANGYKHGRPEGRDVKPADEIVRKVIEALPAEARLYPDVYAWQVTDALEAFAESLDEEDAVIDIALGGAGHVIYLARARAAAYRTPAPPNSEGNDHVR